MTCKCMARTYEGHLMKTKAGYPGHVYRGAIWAALTAPTAHTPTRQEEPNDANPR